MGFLRRKEKKSETQAENVPEPQPGSVVEAIAQKESENVKYGIVFRRNMPNFPTTIDSICSKGIFHRKGLQPEMYLLEVNGEEATWKSPKELAFLLKDAPVGSELSIKATVPKTVRVTRDSEETSWGFSIKNSATRDGIYVDNVGEGSLAAYSGLEHGMLILKINDGETFPNDIKEAGIALKSQDDVLELTVVQLELVVDIDLDACADNTGVDVHTGVEVQLQEERDEIDSNHPTHETFVKNTENEIRDDDMNISPSLVGSQDDMEVIDLDDFSYDEDEKDNWRSTMESRQGPGRKGWFSKKEKDEESFDLDDQFPERYTKNNNALFQSVLFPTSKNPSRTSEVMSQVMQLRKIRKPLARHRITAPNRQALIFGLKNKISMASLESFNPQGRRPRFFKGPSSLLSEKYRSGKLTREHERMAEGRVDAFDWLFSFQDHVCACRGNNNNDIPVETDIMSVTSASSRRSIIARPLRFRKQRANAENFLRNEEVLEL